ncbi:hypothetical protein L598_000900001060 [Mesorhizobium sp. J18]|uniref:hypothetical protein n=1 Tax=Mesorhizobium sp. J18 TaxID=935263 RepID=UPI00119ACB66|nr:hypothetical protein [Mesorhizobium sp. J18]TWG89027.1 hypothetical protein L598_000900001060 [Mesorhizobium sp. J18]
MRTALALLAFLPAAAVAADITSEYTELDTERDCAVLEAAPEGEGDWRTMSCTGWRGYPIVLQYNDVRESIFYGFPPAGDGALVWESFDAFNHAGTRIEWRILADGVARLPLATIHRWLVSDADDPQKETEVLVVEKVAGMAERDGCAIGYVVATGNTDANEKARRIADGQTVDFVCGADQPVLDSGEVPVPSFNRVESE